MHQLFTSLRQVTRGLLRSPLMVLAVVVTLGLAMGANILIFALLENLLLRPLPYENPEDLAIIWASHPERGIERTSVSMPDLLDLQQRSAFSQVEGLRRRLFALTGHGAPEELVGVGVTPGYFEMLEAELVAGRAFSQSDPLEDLDQIVVISEELWTRRFGGDPGVVGQTILLDETSHLVVGVVAAETGFPQGSDLWVPIVPDPGAARGGRYLLALTRLSPETGFDAARDQLEALAAGQEREFPDTHRGWTYRLMSLHEQLVAELRPALQALYASVWLLVTIATVNVASLLLSRGVSRSSDLGLRVALGANRFQILGYLIRESLILTLVSAAFGGLAAFWGAEILRAQLQELMPQIEGIGFNGRVVGYGLLLTLTVGLACGALSSFQAWRISRRGWSLNTRGEASSLPVRRLQRIIVGAQIALVVPLLVSSSLFIKSLSALSRVNPGFNPQSITMVQVAPSRSRYAVPQVRSDFFRQILQRVRSLGGVDSAALVENPPLGGSTRTSSFRILDRPVPEPGQSPLANVNTVSQEYFKTVEIPLVNGVDFPDLTSGPTGLAIINQAFARKYWPGEDPLGERIAVGGPRERELFGDTLERQIIGVVGDVRHTGLDQEARPEIYVPFDQGVPTSMTLVVRSPHPFEEMAGPLREAVWTLDDRQPVGSVESLHEHYLGSYQRERVTAVSVGIFAIVSLLLASLGLYAVIAYSLQRKEREIGIRMAMGARSPNIFHLIARQHVPLFLGSLLLGLILAALVVHLFATQLFGVDPLDPLSYAGTLFMMTVITSVALVLPTWRALRTNPAAALREE